MIDRRGFTERFGDPAKFVFKGQCYDSGSIAKANCTLCGRKIRFCYILKNSSDRSVSSGSCCFGYFEKWNSKLFLQLLASQVWLEATIEAVVRDEKVYVARAEVKEHLRLWRQTKRQAKRRIETYRTQTGKEWLPEDLFTLLVEAEKRPANYKRPTSTIKWCQKQVQVLQEKIQQVKN